LNRPDEAFDLGESKFSSLCGATSRVEYVLVIITAVTCIGEFNGADENLIKLLELAKSRQHCFHID
jgi:hypothetical protein